MTSTLDQIAAETAAAYSAQQVLDAYRQAEDRASLALVLAIQTLFLRVIDPLSIQTSAAAFINRAVPLVVQARARSITLAMAFYSRFRAVESPGLPAISFPTLPDLPRDQIVTSLSVTGPVALRNRLSKIQALTTSPQPPALLVQRAMTSSAAGAAGAAGRHARDGGRDLIEQASKADPVSIGYVRITRGRDTCYYCAMLASRGPVYKNDSFDESDPRFIGPGNAKVHDHCHCNLAPVYKRNSPILTQSAEAEQVWIDSQNQRKPGEDPIHAFRRVWENRAA